MCSRGRSLPDPRGESRTGPTRRDARAEWEIAPEAARISEGRPSRRRARISRVALPRAKSVARRSEAARCSQDGNPRGCRRAISAARRWRTGPRFAAWVGRRLSSTRVAANPATAFSVIPQEFNVPYVPHVVEIFRVGKCSRDRAPAKRFPPRRARRARGALETINKPRALPSLMINVPHVFYVVEIFSIGIPDGV